MERHSIIPQKSTTVQVLTVRSASKCRPGIEEASSASGVFVEFLSLFGQLPFRLTAEQAGWVLNSHAHDVPALISPAAC
jgi:hypothetical protein